MSCLGVVLAAVRAQGSFSKPGDRAVIAMRGCVGEGTWDYSFDDESSATEFAPGGKDLTETEYATLRKALSDYRRIRRFFSRSSAVVVYRAGI